MTYLPTVRVVWGGDPGYLTINEADFDGSIHKLFASTAIGLINAAVTFQDLDPLPGVSAASAKKILAARPADGFGDLDEVQAATGLPASIDWAEIAAWQKPTG